MARSTPVVNLAVLGIQQAASRSSIALPSEAYEHFKAAANAISKEEEEGESEASMKGWVVDLSISAVDVESARLGRLIEGLSIQDKAEK